MNYLLNINPHGPPKSFKRTMMKSYKSLAYQANDGYAAAKSLLAAFNGVLDENILIASGKDELLSLVLGTLRPRKVLVPLPTSCVYQDACKRFGCEVVSFSTEKKDEFDLDAEKLISAAGNVDMIIISNPNNPTSKITDRAKMAKILDYCQLKGIYLVIDESFADFVSEDISSVGKIGKYANIIILKTLSNYFALPGLGLSYSISCQSLTELMQDWQVPLTVSAPSLLAFTSLLGDIKYIKKTKAWLSSEPERFFKRISALKGIVAYKPYANYIFIELEEMPSSVLCERMDKKGIKVCNCNKMGVDERQYIRVAILDKRSNEKFLDAFSGCLL